MMPKSWFDSYVDYYTNLKNIATLIDMGHTKYCAAGMSHGGFCVCSCHNKLEDAKQVDARVILRNIRKQRKNFSNWQEK